MKRGARQRRKRRGRKQEKVDWRGTGGGDGRRRLLPHLLLPLVPSRSWKTSRRRRSCQGEENLQRGDKTRRKQGGRRTGNGARRGHEESWILSRRCQRSKVLGLGSFCKKCSPAHVTRSVLLSIDIMVVFMFSNSRGLVQQLVPRVTSCVRSVQMRWLIVLLHSFNMRQIDEMPPIGLFCSWLKTLNFKCRCALCVRVRLVYSIQPCTRLPSWSTTSTMCSNQNIQKRCVRF